MALSKYRTLFISGLLFILVACSSQRDQAVVVGTCPVTQPNGTTPPGESYEPRYFGNGKLWTTLWPEGTVMIGKEGPGSINADGSLVMSFPWWRSQSVNGPLEVTAKQLDGNASLLMSEVTETVDEHGYQTSSLVFPNEGCWQITAAVGGTSLTIVVYIAVMH
jgi:hypothetical protein